MALWSPALVNMHQRFCCSMDMRVRDSQGDPLAHHTIVLALSPSERAQPGRMTVAVDLASVASCCSRRRSLSRTSCVVLLCVTSAARLKWWQSEVRGPDHGAGREPSRLGRGDRTTADYQAGATRTDRHIASAF